jgi:hypothetical protein
VHRHHRRHPGAARPTINIATGPALKRSDATGPACPFCRTGGLRHNPMPAIALILYMHLI